ncbi:MAG: hypothetical protein EA339_04610 [Rhodobacteraceae bacterium]|nr:MAG: hypothetical protein EA339_04610 [Paracoccaceae bacterium]
MRSAKPPFCQRSSVPARTTSDRIGMKARISGTARRVRLKSSSRRSTDEISGPEIGAPRLASPLMRWISRSPICHMRRKSRY